MASHPAQRPLQCSSEERPGLEDHAGVRNAAPIQFFPLRQRGAAGCTAGGHAKEILPAHICVHTKPHAYQSGVSEDRLNGLCLRHTENFWVCSSPDFLQLGVS